MARTLEPRNLRLLSGGNQQKVVVARWLLKGARLLVCSERPEGSTSVLASTFTKHCGRWPHGEWGYSWLPPDIEEVLSVCDRAVVCFAGRVSAQIDTATATEESLFLAMQGFHPEGDGNGS